MAPGQRLRLPCAEGRRPRPARHVGRQNSSTALRPRGRAAHPASVASRVAFSTTGQTKKTLASHPFACELGIGSPLVLVPVLVVSILTDASSSGNLGGLLPRSFIITCACILFVGRGGQQDASPLRGHRSCRREGTRGCHGRTSAGARAALLPGGRGLGSSPGGNPFGRAERPLLKPPAASHIHFAFEVCVSGLSQI